MCLVIKCKNASVHNIIELKKVKDEDKKYFSINERVKEVLKYKLEASEQNIIDLRCIIEGYNCEIETLNSVESEANESKSGDEDLPSKSKCGQCDYESDSENDIKEHMQVNHEMICDQCDLTFNTKLRLENHTDEIHHSNCKKSESDVYVAQIDIE